LEKDAVEGAQSTVPKKPEKPIEDLL